MRDFVIRLASMKLAELKFDVSIENQFVRRSERHLQESLSFKELEERIVRLSNEQDAVLPLGFKIEVQEDSDGFVWCDIPVYRGITHKNTPGRGSKRLIGFFIGKPDSMSEEIFETLMESLLKRLELRGL